MKLNTLYINNELSANTFHVANGFIEHSENKKYVFGDAINV